MPTLPKMSDQCVASSLRLLFLFNLIDAFLTVMWINSGIAVEANPLMAVAMTYGMSFFVLTKISAVLFAVGILWHTRKHMLSRWVSLASAGAMGSLVIYHAVGICEAVAS